MLGFIHLYAKTRADQATPKDSIVLRLKTVNHESYDKDLNTISTRTLRDQISGTTRTGEPRQQGNLGTLVVLPAEYQLDLKEYSPDAFVSSFYHQRVELSLTANVRIVPAYTFRPTKDGEVILREEPTVIKFSQLDAIDDCYHEVTLSTRHPSLHFSVEATETQQMIDLDEWHHLFEKFKLKVDMREGCYELDKTLFLEDIYPNVSTDLLISTGIGRAFNSSMIIPEEVVITTLEAPLPHPVPPLTPAAVPQHAILEDSTMLSEAAAIGNEEPETPDMAGSLWVKVCRVSREEDDLEVEDIEDEVEEEIEEELESEGDCISCASSEDFSAYFPSFLEKAQFLTDLKEDVDSFESPRSVPALPTTSQPSNRFQRSVSVPPSSTIYLERVSDLHHIDSD